MPNGYTQVSPLFLPVSRTGGPTLSGAVAPRETLPTGKRVGDVVLAATGLVITLPVLALCALLVKATSRGPVLFGHTRCGEGGRTFRCLKFRTMVEGAEEWLERDAELARRHRAHGFKLPPSEDPRITTVGRALRFTHLDELPQLVNVLRGEMSLVGPRPVVRAELAEYGDRAGELLARRPGIFGAWTALGHCRPGYPERIEVELSYPLRPRMGDDIVLLARNVPALLKGQEARRG